MTTTTQWEYLVVTWQTIASFQITDGEFTGYDYDKAYYIWRSGSQDEPETRTIEGGKPFWLDIANELGAEGWELVSRETLSSAVGESNGYPTAGFPISDRSTFKRPKE